MKAVLFPHISIARPRLVGPRSANSIALGDCAVFFLVLGICGALCYGQRAPTASSRSLELLGAGGPSTTARESAQLTPVLNQQAEQPKLTRLLLFGDPQVRLAENLPHRLNELGNGGLVEVVDRRGTDSLLAGVLAEVTTGSRSVPRGSTVVVLLRSQRSRSNTLAGSPFQHSAVADEALASRILASYGIFHGVLELSGEMAAADAVGFWLMRFGWGLGYRSVRPNVMQS